MPCNASYTRFIFGRFFICTTNWYALLCGQNFILVKSECYNCGPRRRRQEGAVAPWRRTRIRARQYSPAMVEEDEAVPEGCSPEHERRWRGGVTEAKNDDDLSSAWGQRKARGSLGERGKRGGEGRGCSSLFIGSKGVLGRDGRGGNDRH
jgi:hypothetical protein